MQAPVDRPNRSKSKIAINCRTCFFFCSKRGLFFFCFAKFLCGGQWTFYPNQSFFVILGTLSYTVAYISTHHGWFPNFIFWASSSNHCLAALHLGADVDQPFDDLIVQNRQAVQSMKRLMDWTLKDNMVDGLLFCTTLTGRREGHTQFVQTGAETPDTGAEAIKSDPGSSLEGRYGGVFAGVGDENAGSRGAVRPLRIPLVISPLRRTYVVVR